MRKIIFLLSLFLVLGFITFSCMAQSYTVLIVQDQDSDAISQILEGFIATLTENGYRLGENIGFEFRYVSPNDIYEPLLFQEYNLIFTIGTEVSKKIIKLKKDLPIVFAMVLDPVQSGIVDDLESPGPKLTGACLDVPVEVQLKLLKKILPHVVKIGVIHSLRMEKNIERASQFAESAGLEIIPTLVAKATEVPQILKDILTKVEVIWLVPDAKVTTRDSLSHILNTALEVKVPVMGFASGLAKAGALFSYTHDFIDNGKQAGELAVKILNKDVEQDLPIAFPRKVGYALNLKTAQHLGLKLPSNIIDEANERF